jgi:hypothetical protein
MHLLVQVCSYKWSIIIQELFFTVNGWGALRLIYFGSIRIIYRCAVGMLNILKTSFYYVQMCKSHKIGMCFKLIVFNFFLYLWNHGLLQSSFISKEPMKKCHPPFNFDAFLHISHFSYYLSFTKCSKNKGMLQKYALILKTTLIKGSFFELTVIL